MILYHGTNNDFDKIDINKTKKYKDFFYDRRVSRET